MNVFMWLVTFLIFVSSASSKWCDRCMHKSIVVAISKDDKTIGEGACGYGDDATEFNGVHPVAAVPSIYIQGAGCGASYQVRCTEKVCLKQGITVIVTEKIGISKTDFWLSKASFMELFDKKDRSSGYVKNLKGTIGVEYKRVESVYGEHQPMCIRVEEMSKNNFAIKILYQGGQTYIRAIEMAFKGSGKYWLPMKRREGAIWQVAVTITLQSILSFKITVTEGRINRQLLTGYVNIRNNGGVYGLRLQLDGKIAQETCDVCDNSTWR